MARTFEREFTGHADSGTAVRPGFFASIDGAPADGYRAPRTPLTTSAPSAPNGVDLTPDFARGVGIITSEYGAAVLRPLVAGLDRDDVRLVPVVNHFFGGTTAVTG